MGVREALERGRSFREWFDQQQKSLTRQEDIASDAAMLMRLRHPVGKRDARLGELYDRVLESLARGTPASVLEDLDGARESSGTNPAFWALGCHYLGHALAEFPDEFEPAARAQLASILPQWFDAFRKRLETLAPPLDDAGWCLWMVLLNQCVIFHDRDAFDAARSGMLQRALQSPGTLAGQLESLGLLAGVALQSREDHVLAHVAAVLDQLGGNADAAAILAVIRPANPIPMGPAQAPMISGTSAAIPGTSQTAVPRITRAAQPKRGRREKGQKKDDLVGPKTGLAALFDRMFDATGFLFWPILIIVIGLLCVGGAGFFMEWVFNTSPVGDQSLGDWYDKAKDQNEPGN